MCTSVVIVDTVVIIKDNALIGGQPGGLTPGNPRAFVPKHLQIPPTQGQYSSTKSYHCPSHGERNLKGLPNSFLRNF